MSIIAVTRHAGAREWLIRQGIRVDRVTDHLDIGEVQQGDIVIGSLPVHLAAKVCEACARYLHLSIDLPAEYRGQELDVSTLDRFNARLEEYHVQRVGDEPAAS